MSPDAAIQHFGSQTALAKAVGVVQPTVSGWRTDGKIPEPRQFQIEVLTHGKLKADREARAA
jgi:DNA-binding transcriptional regulator YdaS (Cro superfamily)